jgi:spore maturation protein CgeB
MIALFCHSLLSDWNHGNAHFLRGLATELVRRGHGVRVFEPADAWSVQNLVAEAGEAALDEARARLAGVQLVRYQQGALDLERALDGVSLALVHEWNEPALVAALGRERARTSRFKLLFHDTHHRSVTERAAMARLDLSRYDGVLAFGEAVRQSYLREGWASRVWTFHEAADVSVFRPLPACAAEADLVWIGNFGDEERTEELMEFLFRPVQALSLRGVVHGVRYPEAALSAVRDAGLRYGGWLPNHRVPEVFARHRLTVHVPRRPYAEALPGVPTIRVFEALACGIPLVSAPWSDSEGLFREGDFVRVQNGSEMRQALAWLLADEAARQELARRGRETILARHTCAHRVEQLFRILAELGARPAEQPGAHRSAPEATSWD